MTTDRLRPALADDDLDAMLADKPIAAPSFTGARGRVAKPTPDPARQRRNRLNRNRGKGTSRDLASFLGGRNVEGLLLPWDVEGPGYRIQAKREARGRSLANVVGLITAIDAGAETLRALYQVEPSRRITSGRVTMLLLDWVRWHGWDMPPFAVLSVAGTVPLLSLPVAVFRDVHIATGDGGKGET